jgi:hypothetical protein
MMLTTMARDATPHEGITEEEFRWLGRQMLEAKGPDAPYWRHGINVLSDLALQIYPDGFPVSKSTLANLTIVDEFPRAAVPRKAVTNIADIFHSDVGEIEGEAILKRLDGWIAHYKRSSADMHRWLCAWRKYFLAYVAPKELLFGVLEK